MSFKKVLFVVMYFVFAAIFFTRNLYAIIKQIIVAMQRKTIRQTTTKFVKTEEILNPIKYIAKNTTIKQIIVSNLLKYNLII